MGRLFFRGFGEGVRFFGTGIGVGWMRSCVVSLSRWIGSFCSVFGEQVLS